MAQSVIFFFFVIYGFLLLATGNQAQLADAMNAQARDEAAQSLAAGINNYRNETGQYPADLNALYTTPGYEHLKSATKPFQNMALSSNLSDGTFRFSRVAFFSHDEHQPVADADFLSAANNACGSGDFASAATWCAPANGSTRWWKQENRNIIVSDIQRERRRLLRLLHKFNAWYNGDESISVTNGVWGNNFPNPGTSSTTLVALTGYAQTAKTCAGIYTWSRIPIDCTDLYSVWGTPTVYNYVSPTHIVLLVQTPFTKADGTPLYVSTEESL